MANVIKVKNSVTAGARPAAGSGTPGELFVNVADAVIGTFNAAGAPVELGGGGPIETFNAASAYAVGDYVVEAGHLYRAKIAVAAGAFDATEWDQVLTLGDFPVVGWDGTKRYSSGSYVTHSGSVFRSTTTVNPGAWNASQWHEITPIQTYSATQSYSTGAFVISNGVLLRANKMINPGQATPRTADWDDVGPLRLTAGSIPFAGADGLMTEDNPELMWDTTNKQLKINDLTFGTGKDQVTSNTVAGLHALDAAAPGTDNVAVGFNALTVNTANMNTAVGSESLGANTSGAMNTAVGRQALKTNISGINNTAVGANSLRLSTGSMNTAVGRDALNQATGDNNVGIGFEAGADITTGTGNVVIGKAPGEAAMTNTVLIADGVGVPRYRSETTHIWYDPTASATAPVVEMQLVKSALRLPAGDDAARPAAPAAGQVRFNTASNSFEGYANGAWGPLATSTAGATYTLPAATVSALGGVKANAGTTGQFVNGVAADGSLTYGTPTSYTPPTYTVGSIPFSDAAGSLTEDNTALFWDAATKSLGIGTATPGRMLDVKGVAQVKDQLIVEADSGAMVTTVFKNSSGYGGFFFNEGAVSEGYVSYFGSTHPVGSSLIFRVEKPVPFIWNHGNSEHMRLSGAGDLTVATSTSWCGAKFEVNNGGNQWAGSFTNQLPSGGGALVCRVENPSTYLTAFFMAGAMVGGITTDGTSTTYGTTSDYRLKENVAPITGAIDRFRDLKPSTWTWKADGAPGEGFIAHELQEHVPHAVSGVKDAVKEDGTIDPQSVDYGKLTPLLTAALQEALNKIDALEARLAILEGK